MPNLKAERSDSAITALRISVGFGAPVETDSKLRNNDGHMLLQHLSCILSLASFDARPSMASRTSLFTKETPVAACGPATNSAAIFGATGRQEALASWTKPFAKPVTTSANITSNAASVLTNRDMTCCVALMTSDTFAQNQAKLQTLRCKIVYRKVTSSIGSNVLSALPSPFHTANGDCSGCKPYCSSNSCGLIAAIRPHRFYGTSKPALLAN